MLRTANISHVCQQTYPSKPFSPHPLLWARCLWSAPSPTVGATDPRSRPALPSGSFEPCIPSCPSPLQDPYWWSIFGSFLLVWWCELVPTPPAWLHQGYQNVSPHLGSMLRSCGKLRICTSPSSSSQRRHSPQVYPPFTQEGLSENEYVLPSC